MDWEWRKIFSNKKCAHALPKLFQIKSTKKNKSTKTKLQAPKIPMVDSILCSTAIISSWSLTLKLLVFQQLIFVIQIQAPVGSGETRLKTKRRSMCHRPIDLPNPKLHHLRSISLQWRACFGVMIPRPSYAMLLVWGKYIQLLNFKKKKVFFHQKTPFACGDWWKILYCLPCQPKGSDEIRTLRWLRQRKLQWSVDQKITHQFMPYRFYNST